MSGPERPLRVLYSFPDAVGKPGIGTTAYHQIQGVIDQGVELTLYCTSVERPVTGARRVVTTLAPAGRRIPHRALGRERAYRFHDRRVALALRRLRSETDVVHCWPGAVEATARAARRLRIRSVREVINTHTGWGFERVARETAALGMELPEGHSHSFDPRKLAREEAEFRAVDLLSAQSEFSKGTFVERGFQPGRFAIHQNGFDRDRFYPDQAERDPHRPLTAIFVGRAEPRKGLHHALRAWLGSGLAERGRFVICGDFVPGYREALGELLEDPSIEASGYVDDVGALMRAADLFVLPSVEEGSALVTYEAQASGCVPLVSDATGARCEHGRQGLVHPAGDSDALREHFSLLDRDRELLARLRAATIESIPSLTWEKGAEELVAVYRQSLDRPDLIRPILEGAPA
jgi:glycosyltransferase involved in cell wall biosynthesis